MILFIGALLALPMLLVFCFYKLGQKIIYHLSKIDEINQEMRRLDKMEIIGMLKDNFLDQSYAIQSLEREIKVEILHLQAIIVQVPQKDRESMPKGANRKPRTAAQKEASSRKRKEWWEKKRREAQLQPSDVVVYTAANSD
jgi:hypothetical protein